MSADRVSSPRNTRHSQSFIKLNQIYPPSHIGRGHDAPRMHAGLEGWGCAIHPAKTTFVWLPGPSEPLTRLGGTQRQAAPAPPSLLLLPFFFFFFFVPAHLPAQCGHSVVCWHLLFFSFCTEVERRSPAGGGCSSGLRRPLTLFPLE